VSDVFVSYARSTEPQAQSIAEALRGLGYSVWRDDEIPAHKPYAEVIEERLRGSKAVLVIWSADAAKSQWVRAEADAARELGTLVQVTVDGTMPPLPFNQIQCAALKEANGRFEGPGWTKLTSSLASLAKSKGAPVSPAPFAASQSQEKSICVLPFANMSGDPEQEYFSDGISEDITTDLSKVSALDVVARNTAFTFKGRSVDVSEIARTLGVSHVLEGSVRKAGGRVRISAQLIDGRTGRHVWAERFDRDLTDIFAMQDEISHAIVDALKLKLLPSEKKAIEDRGTENVEAYNLYLLARQQWMGGTHGDTRREEAVIRLCDRIIDLDPNYGRAWALKALAQVTLLFGYNVGEEDGVAAADRAIQLDPNLAEAYSVKARAALGRRDFANANKEIEGALTRSPDSWEVNKDAATVFLWQHDFERALKYYEKCVTLFPEDLHSWDMVLMCYRALGDEAAIRRNAELMLAQAQAIVDREPNNQHAYARGANALVATGDIPRASEWFERVLLLAPDNIDFRYNFACALFSYPEGIELGLDHLEYVFGRSVGSIIRRADIDTDLDPVREHPRFKKMYDAAMERIAKLDADKAKQSG
jgi:adenylate cyclase